MMMKIAFRSITILAPILVISLITASALAMAQIVRQVTDEKTSVAGPPVLDDAGLFVYTGSSHNSDATNPRHSFQILRIDPITAAATSITSAPDGTTFYISVSDDGQWLAFPSPSDLTGQNHDQSIELFVMNSDGSLLQQLTNDPAVNAGSVTGAAMSGNGQWITFLANTDPLGNNPGNATQLFVINRDGSGLRQLTQAESGSFGMISISDDGARIAFAHTGNLTGSNSDLSSEIFAINSDGTNLRQMTTTAADYSSQWPSLSGNGQKIAFQSNEDLIAGNNTLHQDEIFIIDWVGTNLRQLTKTTAALGLLGEPASQSPSITDDGLTVVFHSNYSKIFPPINFDGNYEIFKIKSDGTGLTALTGTILQGGSFMPVIAGGGGRISYYSIDLNVNLNAMDGTGGNKKQLLVFTIALQGQPDISPDGSRTVFTRATGLFGATDLWRIESDGSDLFQITSFSSGSAAAPSIAADRDTIVFSADSNPAGSNSDLSAEIFKIKADGTGIAQLTNSSLADSSSAHPLISANGATIIFDSDADLTGGNADLSREIFKINIDGSGLQQLTSGPAGTESLYPRINGTGTWLVFESNADLDGGNPDGTYEIYRIGADGTGLQRITGDPVLSSRIPDISISGEYIVFNSSSNPLGTNPEENSEVFIYSVTSANLRQLTSSTKGDSYGARISGNGSWVYFGSTAPFFEEDPDAPSDLYRIPSSGGTIQRVGGLRAGFAGGIGPISLLTGSMALQTDDSGEVSVFSDFGDISEANPDLLSEIWIVDRSIPGRISVSKESPTILSWDVESGPLRYDVIRGDVEMIKQGIGGTTDLDAVTCLENNSPDADTLGFGDSMEPLPGQVFFFLYRGSQGMLDGPGSYGKSSNGAERVPASGDCAP